MPKAAEAILAAGPEMSTAISSVVIDRVVGLLAICLLATMTLPILLGLVSSPAVAGSVTLLLAIGYAGTRAAMLSTGSSRRFSA